MSSKVVEMRLMPILMQLRYLVGGAVLCFVLASVGLYLWEQVPLNTGLAPTQGRTVSYTGSGVAGLVMLFTCASLAVVLSYESSQLFVRYAYLPHHSRATAARLLHCGVGAQVLLGVFFVVVAAVFLFAWGWEVMRCGVIFCLGVDTYSEPAKTKGASFNFQIALMLVCTLIPMAAVMWYRAYTLWLLQRADKAVREARDSAALPASHGGTVSVDGELDVYIPPDTQRLTTNPQSRLPTPPPGATHANPMAKAASMQPYHAAPWKKQLCRIVGTSAGIVVCALLGFWLPNDPRRYTSSTIALIASLDIRRDMTTATGVVPEMPYAWFRTGQIRVSENLNLKLFPGNVFFYVYLLATAVIVFVLRQTQRGRYWMQRRIPRCACFTYGEAAFVVATTALSVMFLIYWIRDHNYKQTWSVKASESTLIEAPERWGRGLGQLAILFLSLLLLPVGRQSVVVTVLGVSRDGLLWFHRAVGYAMLAAAVAHAIAFYVSFYQKGLLWHNLNYLPIIVGQKKVPNDFTVLAATWTTWFMLIAMGIFGLNFMRRRYYELFYYTHLAATYMTLPVMLFHAFAGWMYLLPGMTIFLADQLVRLWQRSAVVRVVHARVISEDTTELAFSVPGRWDMRTVHPGQYVFVCVPELTALQWHPFTLTSVVDEESLPGADREVSASGTVFYVHIKSMGPKTWTGRLHDLARTGTAFSMSVEGPCGTPVDYRRYDDIVLVAGGIGAAPCVSVYGSLLREHVRCGGCVPRVRLVWSTRSASLVGAVADMLQLPASYRGLVKEPVADTPGKGRENGAVRGTAVEVATAPHLADGVFTCDIFVTRRGELQRFSPVPAPDAEHGNVERESVAACGGVAGRGVSPVSGSPAASAVNRGGRLRVQEGRPDVAGEIMRALTDASTGCVVGDVARKLVLVCGPEGMVADAAVAAAAIGVVVHSEEYLF